MKKKDIALNTRIFLRRQEIDERVMNLKKYKHLEGDLKVGASSDTDSGPGNNSEFRTLLKHRIRLRKFCGSGGHAFRRVERVDLDYSPLDFAYIPVESSICVDCQDVQVPPVHKCVKCSSLMLHNTEINAPKIFGHMAINRCDCCGHTERGSYRKGRKGERFLPKKE